MNRMMIPLTVIALTALAGVSHAKEPVDSTTLVRAPSKSSTPAWASKISGAKGALEAEKDTIEKKQAAIDEKATPLATQLNAVTAKIDAHNAAVEAHNDGCSGTSDDESEVARCNEEADRLNAISADLNSQKAALVGPLQDFVDQYDELENRRQQIVADLSKLEQFAKQSQSCADITDPVDAAGCLNELWANGLPVAVSK